jgi:DNA-directed RNA polymerase subunit M/transcription elongation factor TFIIS
LKSAVIVETPPNCLWPEGPLAKEMVINRERSTKKEGKTIMHDPDYKGMFKCGKCKGWKTTYYEMQTRSADEPMTVFITCHNCNSTWKS